MPKVRSVWFLLLADLGHGVFGKAWLACNSKGRLCVVKICKNKVASSEAVVWNALLHRARRQTHFEAMPYSTEDSEGKYSYLVMPFLNTIKEPPDQTRVQATREIIHHMASLGYQHTDLKWQHVGFYTYCGREYAMLFDFSHVKSCVPCTDSELGMLKDLHLTPEGAGTSGGDK